MSAAAEYVRRPGLARLWEAARRAYERNSGVGGAARVTDLTEEEAFELDGFAPRPGSQPRRAGGVFNLPLPSVDARVRESGLAGSLKDLLEELGGPLRDRPAERREHERTWTELWQEAEAHPVCQSEALRGWVEGLRRIGTLKQLAPGEERELLERALVVLTALSQPPIGQFGGATERETIPRSQLASELFADPHALDSTEPLHTVVIGGLAAQAGRDRPRDAAAQRELWREFGVLCDSLSCDVLTLGLRPVDESPSAQGLRIDIAAGRAERLTLQDLQKDTLRFEAGIEVFVCENPAVVLTATERLGAGSKPLICTDGHPNTAVFVLLERLVACGARVHVRGDFDWEGLRIADAVAERFDAHPWRFDAATYMCAAEAGGRGPIGGRRPSSSRWPQLYEAMADHGVGVYEEDIVEELISDLQLAAVETTVKRRSLADGARDKWSSLRLVLPGRH